MATTKPAKHFLSKSSFKRGVKCQKSLYLDKHKPELRDEMSDDMAAVFATGHEVGELAQKLFPGGHLISHIDVPYGDQIRETAEALKTGKKIIYEAAFDYDGVFARVDILRKGKKGWELYEVKSSGSVKDDHYYDAAIQYHVLKGAGLDVAKVAMVHVNTGYVRKGKIDLEQYFTIADITEDVIKLQSQVKKLIPALRTMLAGPLPRIDIGEHCDLWYGCDFNGHCWMHIPENSVFDLCGSNKVKYGLYRQGVVKMADISLDRVEPRQRFQLEAFMKKSKVFEAKEIGNFLDSLWYPLCFLDFETFNQAVPPFDGTSPYQQIPFQYSLDVIAKKGAKPKHYEYLAEPGADAREEIARRLTSEIPEGACVLTYYKSFETGRLQELADWLPKYRKRLNEIIGSIRDLRDPFKDRHAYHWKMQGSASLKDVLPAMVPGMSYEGMEIADGGMANSAYLGLGEVKDRKEREKIRKALLEYCGQDTEGMIRIWEKLREIAKQN